MVCYRPLVPGEVPQLSLRTGTFGRRREWFFLHQEEKLKTGGETPKSVAVGAEMAVAVGAEVVDLL